MADAQGQGGIASYDPLTEKFRNYYPGDTASQSTSSKFSTILFEDEEGNIWFKHGTFFPLHYTTFRLNPTTGVMKEYPVADFMVADISDGNPDILTYLRSFGTVESSHTVWMLDDKSNLRKLNRQKDSFEIMIPAGKTLSSSGVTDTLRQLGKGGGDRLLLTSWHGLYIYNTKTEKIVKSYVHKMADATSIADSIIEASGRCKRANMGITPGRQTFID